MLSQEVRCSPLQDALFVRRCAVTFFTLGQIPVVSRQTRFDRPATHHKPNKRECRTASDATVFSKSTKMARRCVSTRSLKRKVSCREPSSGFLIGRGAANQKCRGKEFARVIVDRRALTAPAMIEPVRRCSSLLDSLQCLACFLHKPAYTIANVGLVCVPVARFHA